MGIDYNFLVKYIRFPIEFKHITTINLNFYLKKIAFFMLH